MVTFVFAMKSLNMNLIVAPLIVNGQTGGLVVHVPRVVVGVVKDIPDIKLQLKVMVDHVQDQMKNIVLVIFKAALVSSFCSREF